MKKLLHHSWKGIDANPHNKACKKCGCVKYWDFGFQRIMYQWGGHITYKAPDCIAIMNGQKPYNPRIVNQINLRTK